MEKGSRDRYISILFIIILLIIPLLFISVPKLITGYVFNTGYTLEDFDGLSLENKGIVTGATLITQDSKIGNAYSFDGDDYIDITSLIGAVGDTFSFDGWIYINNPKDNPCIICKSKWTKLDWSIGYYEHLNRLEAGITFTGKKEDMVGAYSKDPLQKDTWYHFAVVKTKKLLTVYINGEKGISIPADFSVNNDPNIEINIGQDAAGSNKLKGKVDHLVYYDYALTEEEINNHYTLNYEKVIVDNCNENWQCDDWNSCVNHKQTRSCNDLNNCNKEDNKPLTEQFCQTDPKLVLYLPFDNDVNDYSGLNNHGTNNGAISKSSEGKINGAFQFTNNQFVEVPYSNNLALDGPFTVETWVKYTDIQDIACCSDYPIINRIDRWDQRSWSLRFNWGQNPWFSTYDSNNNEYNADFYNWPFEKNTWYHLVGLYDGIYTKLYINGFETGKKSVVFNTMNPLNSGILVGDQKYYCCGTFTMLLDEIRIYNYPLSSLEILNHYNLNYEEISQPPLVECVENWQCAEWSACSNNQQTRTCFDSSNCGTDVNKPLEQQSCVQNVTCVEDWTCTDWSNCSDEIHIRACVDNNNCGTEISKPQLQTPCGNETCTELWKCSDWNECTNNLQTRTCSDENNCGTELEKPILQKSCSVICNEEWKCAEWSNCKNEKQTRTCFDANDCGTFNSKPIEEKSCEQTCEENWSCSEWSECYEGVQRRECMDNNYCGTQEKRPLDKLDCECVLETAYWSKTEAKDKEVVELVIESSNCKGKLAEIEIIETDGIFGSKSIEQREVVINDKKVSIKWNAIWEDDNILPLIKGDPEYIFRVTINPEIISQNVLTVYEETLPILEDAGITLTPSESASVILIVTDVPSNATIRYGLTQSLGSEVSNLLLNTEHTLILSPLQPETTYYYQIEACDNIECEVLPISTFTTERISAESLTDWPQLQHDPQRTGRTSLSVIASNVAKWVWVDEDHITHNFVSEPNTYIDYPQRRDIILSGDVQPIVAENTIFFGSSNGEFYALNAEDASTIWKQDLGGAILHTAAYSNGIVITGNMDRNIYALDANTGQQLWVYETEAGISVAPLLMNDVVYIGSRDGYFYALDLYTGQLIWRYRTIAESENHPHSGAPIMQPASSDGSRIFFGAENMYFYALDANTGTELWRKKVEGQSFMYTWPVVYLDPVGNNDLVMTFVMVPFGKSEHLWEEDFDALPNISLGESRVDYAARVWPLERAMIRDKLANYPEYKNFHVMRTNDGSFPFVEEVPMGRVGGIGYPGRSPVIDNQDRILMYWRTKSATHLTQTHFGSKWAPDISAMNPNTGDRSWIDYDTGFGVELDNNCVLTVGGNWLYYDNHMRGSFATNLETGEVNKIANIMAVWDGTSHRLSGGGTWGYQIVYWGNDDDPDRMGSNMPPPSTYRSPQGDSGVVIAEVNGRPLMIVQESGHYQINFGAITVIEGS